MENICPECNSEINNPVFDTKTGRFMCLFCYDWIYNREKILEEMRKDTTNGPSNDTAQKAQERENIFGRGF